MTARLALQPACRPQRVPIGASREPVIVIDGVLADPHALVDRAADAEFADAGSRRGGYPGIRAPAPADYTAMLVEAVEPLIRRVFGLGAAARGRVDGSFSIVTTPPEALHPLQRVPHVDTCSPYRIALLHFLCGAEHGGTAFFRHRATGLEQIPPDAFDRYAEARRAEGAALPAAAGYPNETTPGFERIAAFEARCDRLLVYRSFSLHSGIIPAEATFAADPRLGRLTANLFVDYLPAGAPARR
ncbi:hypothetical protein E2493_09695 [Sphingomonas parva]|uniref:Uncharacterized protein n=1 Tax=Sphingomonas parva TaxID=2555898 RepID=A0A4Y8ZVQ5_9SPHN|nr:DUF6445 family protein [Sphingomonas parva]TFI58516.1 hypothetical protein E2493_09695 [Sphingomonas parva]